MAEYCSRCQRLVRHLLQLHGRPTSCALCLYRSDGADALPPDLLDEAVLLGLNMITREKSPGMARVDALQHQIDALHVSIAAREERLRQYGIELDALTGTQLQESIDNGRLHRTVG